jgi:hypothetical protein
VNSCTTDGFSRRAQPHEVNDNILFLPTSVSKFPKQFRHFRFHHQNYLRIHELFITPYMVFHLPVLDLTALTTLSINGRNID